MFLSALLVGGGALWAFGVGESLGLTRPRSMLKTIRIDEGDIQVFVMESGTLESSRNATVKCRVEALIGLVGGQQGGMGGGQGGRNQGSGNNSSQQNAYQQNSNSGSGNTQVAPAVTKKSAGGSSKTGGGTSSTKSGGGSSGGSAGGSSAGGSSAGSAGGSGSGGAGAMTAGGGGGTGVTRPVIQSFSMMVTPHQPLRPKTSANANATAKNKNQGGGGGSGGGGGGGGNRGGGNNMATEKAGSTRVLSLVPEGKQVKAGDIVCELDSAAFRDELRSQLIRWEQAKSWVDQAQEILRVSEISLREYRDGIYPQDLQQIDKYIQICETQLKQSQDSVKWSREMTKKGLLSPSQLRASEYGEEQVRISLQEANGMRKRLVKFSAPRLLVNLEAKIASVQSDLLAQKSTFQLEDDRKRRLEKMIDFCTLRAPGDGMVAYARDSSGPPWASTQTPMQEGVTVRQGQTILLLPDPKHMRVKVRVNESKVTQVHPGQRAAILIEAFPDRPLTGTVTEVTAIPAPANGPSSDVKLYYANVDIEGGFEGLRTGLSAQVAFFVAGKDAVPKIPLQSIRWAGGSAFAAVPKQGEQGGFEWRALELGLVGSSDAEVVSGLRKGEAIIAKPDDLPAPPAARVRTQISAVPSLATSG